MQLLQVNAPTLNQVMLDENKPWFELCHCLGVLGSFLLSDNSEACNMELRVETFGMIISSYSVLYLTCRLDGL